VIAEAKAAAEDRHTRRVMRHVSERYSDDRGLDGDDLRNLLRGQFLMHQSVHLYTRIQSIEFPTPVRAEVILLAGMAGSPVDSEASLAALSRHDEDLLGVRVLARLDIDKCRERQVAHGRRTRIDDLVRHFRTTGRACDHVVLTDRVAFVTKPQFAFAL
jgi:hypothetical protein